MNVREIISEEETAVSSPSSKSMMLDVIQKQALWLLKQCHVGNVFMYLLLMGPVFQYALWQVKKVSVQDVQCRLLKWNSKIAAKQNKNEGKHIVSLWSIGHIWCTKVNTYVRAWLNINPKSLHATQPPTM